MCVGSLMSSALCVFVNEMFRVYLRRVSETCAAVCFGMVQHPKIVTAPSLINWRSIWLIWIIYIKSEFHLLGTCYHFRSCLRIEIIFISSDLFSGQERHK